MRSAAIPLWFATACADSPSSPITDAARDATTQETVIDAPTRDTAAPDATTPDATLDATTLDATPDAPAADTGPATPPELRVLTFRNECPSTTVQIGATGGYVRDCGADGACPAGTACLRDRMPPGCFWVLPTPDRGGVDLRPGESAEFTLRAPAINHVLWSGNVYGRTDCAGGRCSTGACPGGVCRPGVGPQGPVTLAEFTLQDNAPDYYDVSLINGVNLPMAMAADPRGAYRAAPASPHDAFWCGAAGGVTPSHPALTACSWRFDPTIDGQDRGAVLRLVTPGTTRCAADGACPAGTVCGLAMESGTTRVTPTCGAQLGWWTAHELCGFTAGAFGAPLSCASAPPGGGGGTRANLFACNGPFSASCYSAGAQPTCCGCPTWPYLTAGACNARNADWNTVALPWVSFLKRACPTGYSFQYDDLSSTMTCQSAAAPNGADYTVTFCPGGRRGF